MNLQMLATNLKRLRAAKEISQSALAKSAGLSLPVIKNLEKAKSNPRMNTLHSIAKALDIGLRDLFVESRELKSVRFRSNKKMQNRENILADVAIKLDDFNYLEQKLKESRPFKLKGVACSRCDSSKVAGVAMQCRKKLNLKDREPIHDICGLLESAGIKLFTVKSRSDDFFGLSIGEEDGGPAIVVNVSERIPVERQIFSAAHELGHILLHKYAYDVNIAIADKEEERQANIFASYFLMPDDGLINEWNDAIGLHWIDRILKVKRIFHVSYKAILMRLIERGHANEKTIWKQFSDDYFIRYGRRLKFKEEPDPEPYQEPFGLQQFDFVEDRLSKLVRLAIEKDKISIGRGAEMLKISLDEMRSIVKMWGKL